MPASIIASITSLPNLPMNPLQFAQAIFANAVFTITGTTSGINVGGPMPTTDKGPWIPAGSNTWWFWNASAGAYLPNAIVPTGAIMAFGGTVPPEGWLLADGNVYAQGTYPNLFTTIGYNYSLIGSDNTKNQDTATLTAASQFRVPDTRSRFWVGSGQGTANKSNGSGILTSYGVGDRIGQERVAIKKEDLPDFDIPAFEFNADATQGTIGLYGGYHYDPGSGVYHFVNTTAASQAATNVPPGWVGTGIIRT